MSRRWWVSFSLFFAIVSFVSTSFAATDSSVTGAGKVVSLADTSSRTPVTATPTDTVKKQQAAVTQQAATSAPKDTTHASASPATVAPATSAKPASAQKKKPVEEDLYEELLVPEEGAPQPAAAPAPQPVPKTGTTTATSVSAPQKQADTTKAATPISAPATAVSVSDTGKSAHAPTPSPSVQIQAVDTSKKQAEVARSVVPVKVEAAKSINFARGVKEYRSPKLAMLLSLLVPGLGQAYVKSYVKAGLFLVVEGAIIGTSVAFMNIGKNQYNQATAFADRNYSVTKMSSYYNSLYAFMSGQIYNDSATADTAINAIYGDTLKSFIQGSKVKSSSYYQTLTDQGASNPYVQGWNDCVPTLAQIDSINNSSGRFMPGSKYNFASLNDSLELQYLIQLQDKKTGNNIGLPVYGYSDSMLAYQKIMAQSSDNTKIAVTVLFVLILNHVVSAVDALITANAYNDELLGKQSFWQHINFEPSVAGSGFQIGPAISLRLQF